MNQYKSKYKTDYERLEMVKAFKASRMSVMEFSRKNNISRETLRGWINAYNNIDGSFVRLNKVIDEPGTLLTNDDVTVKMLDTEQIIKKSSKFTRFDHSVVLIEVGKLKITTSLEQALKILEITYDRFK